MSRSRLDQAKLMKICVWEAFTAKLCDSLSCTLSVGSLKHRFLSQTALPWGFPLLIARLRCELGIHVKNASRVGIALISNSLGWLFCHLPAGAFLENKRWIREEIRWSWV